MAVPLRLQKPAYIALTSSSSVRSKKQVARAREDPESSKPSHHFFTSENLSLPMMKMCSSTALLTFILVAGSVECFSSNPVPTTTGRSCSAFGSSYGCHANNGAFKRTLVMPPLSALPEFWKGNSAAERRSRRDERKSSTAEKKKIGVKPRPTVSIDPKTETFIRPDPNVGPLPVLEDDVEIPETAWDRFKDTIYGTLDTIGGGSNNKADDVSSSVANRKAPMAYSSTIEIADSASFLSQVQNETPGNKLLKQYEQSLNKDSETAEQTDLYRSDGRKAFDAAKDGVYQGLDAVLSKSESSTNNALNTRNEKFDSIRPVAKPSVNQDETLTSLKPYLADLSSSNPLTRFRANIAVASIERRRKRREQEMKRRQAIEDAKDKVFKTIDTVQNAGSTIANIPKQVGKSLEATQDAIEEASIQAQDAIEEVQTIPGKVAKAVDGVKASVEETKEISKVVANDIRNIPKTVEGAITDTKKSVVGKIEDTQKTIRDTKEGVKNFQKKVEDMTYDVKVLAGMEQPRPPPPPPPKTSRDVAFEIADSLTNLAGKGAWILAKGSVGMIVSGIKLAWSAVMTNRKESAQNEDTTASVGQVVEKASTPKTLFAPKTVSIPTRKSKDEKPLKEIPIPLASNRREEEATLNEIDPVLEKEVFDALRLAEEALAEVEKEKGRQAVTNIDINEAVLRAKKAAAKATKDAADLQMLVQSRRQL